MAETDAVREITKHLEPKPRYRRVVDRYECPMCGDRLGETWWDGKWTARVYTDDQQIAPPSQLKRRIFHPCGCEDYALVSGVTADV